MIDDNRGKSAYAVLAASTKIANVEICKIRYIGVPLPNTARPITDNSVSLSDGTGPRGGASTAMAKKHEPRIAPMIVSVVAAFFDSGLRNAGTPLEIAS